MTITQLWHVSMTMKYNFCFAILQNHILGLQKKRSLFVLQLMLGLGLFNVMMSVQSFWLLRSIFLLLLSCNACRPLMLMRCCCWVDTKPAVIWCVDPCHSTSLIPIWALLCCVTNWTKPLHHHTGPADEHESCVSSD